jgi:hypothetical protein
MQSSIFLDTFHVPFTQAAILTVSQGDYQVDIRTASHPTTQVGNKADIQTAIQLDKIQPGNQLTIQTASRLYRKFQVHIEYI